MKSFTSKVKEEILSSLPKDLKHARSLFSGMLIFGGKFSGEEFTISCENKEIIETLYYLTPLIWKKLKFKKSIYKKPKKTIYSLSINKNNEILKKIISLKKDILPKNINFFISGAFLMCASITSPEIDYHIEFHLNCENLCKILLEAFNKLEKVNLNPKLIKRPSGYYIYIKGNEKIEDLLVLIGANSCAMEFMQVKMIKEIRNNINRTTNFETANLSKITKSSTEQICAIKKIIKNKKLETLPENLKEIAHLRLNNPYVSLKELAIFCKNPVSKSGVNHRLKKIIEIAREI